MSITLSSIITGTFVGPGGATGSVGVQGASGPQGPTGGASGPTGASGATGSVGVQGASGALSPWGVVSSNFTAKNGDRIIADSSNGSFTITLPANPVTGAYVVVTDANDWHANNVTIARNGSTIENVSDDLLLTMSGITVELIYSGSSWIVTATAGVAGASGATGSLPTSYETVSKNLSSYAYTITYTGNNVASVAYTTPSGTITKSYTYTNGSISQISISGDGLGYTYKKNLTYDASGFITNVSYTTV
jgi:hypothetical protein